MKIFKNAKILLSVVVTFGIIMLAGQVFAAEDNYQGITLDLNAKNNTTNTASNTAANNTVNNTTVLTTNNTTKYNNTALPSTGIGDAMPVTILLVIFGISAVYAYKKVQAYRNI